MHFPSYSAPPRQPFRLPISSHPPAAPCGPGRVLPQGQFAMRGGVFEGPAMAHGDEQCGYWSDHVQDAPLWNQGFYPQRRPAPPYGVRNVHAWPPETRSHFQPRGVMLGFPRSVYPRGMGAVPGAGVQPMDPMHTIVNRRRQVWTGPTNPQAGWPDGMTPRGGVLDGNTLAYHKQGRFSAYYDGGSPQVMTPVEQIDVMPNPLDQGPVPTVGWGIPGTPADLQLAGMGEYYSAPGAGGVRQLRGMGEYFTPAGVRAGYGAQEAQRPAPIMRGDQSDSQNRAICRPKAVASSVFGGRVPGGPVVGRSVFEMPVYSNGGNVPERVTIDPQSRAVSAFRAGAAVNPVACGAGPDGLAGFG